MRSYCHFILKIQIYILVTRNTTDKNECYYNSTLWSD